MHKTQHRMLIAGVLLCFVLFSAFWGNESKKASVTSTQKEYRIEVILKAYQNPPSYWQLVAQGMQAARAEIGVKCTITAPYSEKDTAQQIELMEQAISRKPDAIILAACSYDELVPVCKKAVEKGITLLTVDSDVNYDGRAAFIGTNNYDMGKKLAGLVEDEIGTEEAFGVISHVEGTSTATQRMSGLMQNMTNAGERLSGFAYCDGDELQALAQTKQMLGEHPEIKCMVGLNESSALGIAVGLQQLGLQDEVALVVCDSSEKQIHFLEDETIRACVVQNPFSMGYLSVVNAVQLLQKKTVPATTYTDSVVVYKNNLNNAKYQQLIIPFTR